MQLRRNGLVSRSFDVNTLKLTEMDSNLSESLNEKPKKIGAAPDFAIANDSTEETPWQKALLSTHFLLFGWNVLNSLMQLDLTNVQNIVAASMVLIFSIILGDFGTGVFHWSVDNYGSLKTPVFGSVCAAFQGHHKTPWTITFRSFANNVFKITYATIPFFLIMSVLSLHPLTKLFFSLFVNWWLVSQEFHKYSHMRDIPQFMKTLQNKGIILSRKEHGLHHNSPFEGHYCILTGVCNPILDNSLFFRHMERLVYKLTGNKPITWTEDEKIEQISMNTKLFP